MGTTPDFGLARYNADGSLDTTFGVSGFVDSHLEFGAESSRVAAEQFASDVAIQPDGKILEVGSVAIVEQTGGGVNVTQDMCLARFDATGKLDASFGVNGYVTTQFLTETFNPVIAFQPDGKIVVVGVTTTENSGTNFELALARFNADGSLDPSFGTNGITITVAPSGFSYNQPPAVALQPDGKIIIAAGTSPADGSSGEFVVARYDASGTLDTTFGQDGLITTQFAGNAAATSVALQPDGRIIAGGFAGNDFALRGTSQREYWIPRSAKAVWLPPNSPDGPRSSISPFNPTARFSQWDRALSSRYDASGQLDTSFGQDGKVVASFGPLAVFFQPGGTFTAAGRRGGYQDQFALARYFLYNAPTVSSLRRFGFHAQPTVLVLTFDASMNPTRAEDTANYELVAAGPDGRFGTRDDRRISFKSAIYNAPLRTVTLVPPRRLSLHKVYRLTVNGESPNGLTDAYGIFLDGAGTGQPGTDFVASFDGKILVIPTPRFHPVRPRCARTG